MEEGKLGKWAIACVQLVSVNVLEKKVVQMVRIQAINTITSPSGGKAAEHTGMQLILKFVAAVKS